MVTNGSDFKHLPAVGYFSISLVYLNDHDSEVLWLYDVVPFLPD